MLGFVASRHQLQARSLASTDAALGAYRQFMRFFAAFLVLAAITTGGAEASSFVVLESMTESVGPSMMVLGAPAPENPSMPVTAASVAAPSPSSTILPGHVAPPSGQIVLSPSIIAMGEPATAIEYENVAAIQPAAEKEKRPQRPAAMPMVIRGGLVSDAFERPASIATPQATTQEKPVADAADTGTPAKRNALKNKKRRRPAPPEPDAILLLPEPPGPVEQ